MELLTILLPGSIDLEPTSRRTDKDGLSAALVSAAMAGANPIGLNMLKAAYAGDTDAERALHEQFYTAAETLAKIQRWKFREKDKKEKRLRLLVDIAMLDIIASIHCPLCKGAKQNPDNPAEKCPKCDGNGSRRYTGRAFARALNMNEANWRNTWERRYYDLVQLLQEKQHDARRHIQRKLLT